MPSDVDFHLPFPSVISPDADVAEAHTIAWLLHHGVLRNQEEARYIQAMRPGDIAGRMYPEARGADLDLAIDHMCLVCLVNDQVDSTTGQRARQAAAICHDVLALLRSDHSSRPTTAFGTAWCEVWDRLSRGMSPQWRDRTISDHVAFFSELLSEQRLSRTFSTVEDYDRRRQVSTGTQIWLDVTERVGRYEVPDRALASEVVQGLLKEANTLVYLPSDVHGVEREELRGETDNMILVIEHTTGRPREDVIAEIQAVVHDAAERFLRLQSEVPGLYARLRLDAAEQAALASHIRAMTHIIRGSYDWARTGTARGDLNGVELAVASGYEDIHH
ncbi:hypothetical protein AB0F18_21650 [Streptomyces sp. NPDC029216]|uniref:terpene synthase family protein n=1 Tax=Streptomyces sp. NPDC029216 TaxID=3154701 RepID=UPI00340A691E